jgi:hypothetical protein
VAPVTPENWPVGQDVQAVAEPSPKEPAGQGVQPEAVADGTQ